MYGVEASADGVISWMQIPMITYFCVTVGLALIIALCLLHTWFVAWMYVLERNRMAAARARGDTELARVNGGESLLQPPLGAFFESVGRALTRPWVKVLVLALALGLVGTAPYGISQVVPGYGPRDFVKGCGVFCDPSYLLDFVEEQEAGFVPAPLPVTLMVRGFDLNAQQEELQLLLSRLAAHGAGTQSSATSVAEVGARPADPQGGEHHTCPTSCMDTSNGLGPVSCAPPPPPAARPACLCALLAAPSARTPHARSRRCAKSAGRARCDAAVCMSRRRVGRVLRGRRQCGAWRRGVWPDGGADCPACPDLPQRCALLCPRCGSAGQPPERRASCNAAVLPNAQLREDRGLDDGVAGDKRNH
jgi:hypothetical protein